MLAKILKGSRDKKIFELGLDKCPIYGFYHSLTLEEITHRIDWMIKKDYLRIDDIKNTIERQEEGPVMTWLKAQKSDADQIARLVEKTILQTYPHCYSKEITDFFCFLHNTYRIKADIEKNHVWMLLCDGRLVGTGSAEDNHITRVYVPKEEQGKGFGSYIMNELENRIRKKFERAELDASLPAEHFYEKRGYRMIRQEALSVGEMTLSYKVMEKVFSHGK